MSAAHESQSILAAARRRREAAPHCFLGMAAVRLPLAVFQGWVSPMASAGPCRAGAPARDGSLQAFSRVALALPVLDPHATKGCV